MARRYCMGEWWGWNSNPGCLAPEACSLTALPSCLSQGQGAQNPGFSRRGGEAQILPQYSLVTAGQ